ncbi:MAG: peptidylprolyl isomerase [Geminicoccaceae bacterium]
MILSQAMRARALVLVLALLVCALPAPNPVRAADEQRIAAVVNDSIVSLQDLNERLRLVLLTSGIRQSEQARDRLAPQVLRSLVEETLQMQEAKRLDITVDDSEIQQALQSIAERNHMTTDSLHRLLSSNGVNFDTLLRQIRAQIAWVKVINRQVRPKVNVTVDQLEMAVQEARASQGQPEYLLSEIVLPVDSPDQADKVAADATRLVQTLREGASFDALARQVSAASSAERGGDLGWVSASAIPNELLTALERLRPGEISDPIGSPIGFHVFWLRDRRTTQAPVDAAAASVEVHLTQILFPQDDTGDPTKLAELREQAANLRDRLTDCPAMVQVAQEIGAPASGDLGWLRIGDLPPDLGHTVLSLPIGEVSQPLQDTTGIRLLMVCERRGDQPATSSERDQIAERLEREQIDRLARRYLRDLRKDAFIEVRL